MADTAPVAPVPASLSVRPDAAAPIAATEPRQSVAGPSSPRRISPSRHAPDPAVLPSRAEPIPAPISAIQSASEDVDMTDVSAVDASRSAPSNPELSERNGDPHPAGIASRIASASQSAEAELLLSFSAERTDATPLVDQRTEQVSTKQMGEESPAPRPQGIPQYAAPFAQVPPPPPVPDAVPNGQIPPPNTESRTAFSSPQQATDLSLSRQSPEAGTAPKVAKQKRKRNAAAGPSRRKSNDRATADGLPAHYMGENNEVIRCICGISEDTGLSVQCERCGAWQHSRCWGFVDGQVLPDIWLCELCNPRPFDAARARLIQFEILEEQHRKSGAMAMSDQRDELNAHQEHQQQQQLQQQQHHHQQQQQRPRGKPKRPRHDSTADGDGEVDGKDGSPGVMGPPTVKPKRRQPGPKPRAKQVTIEASPTPMTRETTAQQQEPEESLYFTLDPWEKEYTPVKENLFRSTQARRKMCAMYQDWIDDEMRLSQKRSVDGPSGMPSPTETGVMRLSPDNVLPRPQFGILDPPVPPVYMSGKNIDSLAAPVTVRPVTETASFLPLSYLEGISSAAIYTAPAMYSVHTDEPLAEGAYIGEYRGEVVDCEAYRRDPINQYSSLGVPKPFVRAVAPPVDLLIDARGYGTVLRFIRSGCHPNTVIRPFFWREAETEAYKLRFGVYASREIVKNEELVLGWEWDDQHAVHALSTCAQLTVLRDGSVGQAAWSIPAQLKLVDALIDKFDWVLTHLLGMYMPCACVQPGNCALAQMRFLVETRGEERSSAGRRGGKADLGPLVGAVRGWRRRELESAQVKRWILPEALFGLKPRQHHINPVQAPESLTASEEDSGDQQSQGGDEAESSAGDEDVHDEEVEYIENVGNASAAAAAAFSRSHRTPSPALPQPSSELSLPTTSPRSRIRIRGQPAPTMAPQRRAADSQLSEADIDDGDLTDATTATLPRTVFSDSEDDEPDEVPDMIPAKSAPTNGRKRRVSSPPLDSSDMSSPPHARSAVHVPPVKRRKPGPKPKGADKKAKRLRADSDVRRDDDEERKETQKRKIRLFTSPPLSDDESTFKRGKPDAPSNSRNELPAVITQEARPATPPRRDPTPPPPPPPAPPKEPSPEPVAPPPPREPTPPPVEKKKIALADYLKTHKIRKETAGVTPSTQTPVDTPVNEVPGSIAASTTPGSMLPPATTSSSAAASAPDQKGLNLSEFLPSGRTPGLTSTPGSMSAAYTPRSQMPPQQQQQQHQHQQQNEYFPPQPANFAPPAVPAVTPGSSAYQPRYSSSYTPRAPSMSSESDTSQAPPATQAAFQPSSAYMPRSSSGSESLDAQRRSASLDEHLPPSVRTPNVQTKPLDDHLPPVTGQHSARPDDRHSDASASNAMTPRHANVPMPPVEPPSPAGPGAPPGGYVPFGQRRPSFSPQMSIGTIPPSPRDRGSYLPPVLASRDPPPHHHLSPGALGDRVPLPDQRFERQTSETPRDRVPSGPRAPPTGPKVPPTGPRGTWNGPPPPLSSSNNYPSTAPPPGSGSNRVVSGGSNSCSNMTPATSGMPNGSGYTGGGPGPGPISSSSSGGLGLGTGPGPGPAPPTSIYGSGGAGYGPPRGGGGGGGGGGYGHRGGGFGDRGFYRGRGYGRGRGRGG